MKESKKNVASSNDKQYGEPVLENFEESFTCFLKKCKKASGLENKKRLREEGHAFLEKYKDQVHEKEIDEFKKLEELWIQEEQYKSLSNMSFTELVEFQDFDGLQPEYRHALKTVWSNIISSKLRNESITMEILQKLTAKAELLTEIGEKKQRKYKKAVWNACGDNLELRMYCSVFFGIEQYSIWSYTEVCDTIFYESVYQFLMNPEAEKYLQVETVNVLESVSEKAETNRLCYLLWRQGKIPNAPVRDFRQNIIEAVTETVKESEAKIIFEGGLNTDAEAADQSEMEESIVPIADTESEEQNEPMTEKKTGDDSTLKSNSTSESKNVQGVVLSKVESYKLQIEEKKKAILQLEQEIKVLEQKLLSENTVWEKPVSFRKEKTISRNNWGIDASDY